MSALAFGGLSVDEFIARQKAEYDRAHGIFCPKCGAEYDDTDERQHVSYWGEDEPKEADCGKCEATFWVKERVDRTWETSADPRSFD